MKTIKLIKRMGNLIGGPICTPSEIILASTEKLENLEEISNIKLSDYITDFGIPAEEVLGDVDGVWYYKIEGLGIYA